MDNSSVGPGRFRDADLAQLRQVLSETAAATTDRFLVTYSDRSFPVSFGGERQIDLSSHADSLVSMIHAINAAGEAFATHGDAEGGAYGARISQLFAAGQLLASIAEAMRGRAERLP
jgi:hypothetical protein